MKKQILFPLIFGFISTLTIAQVPNDVYRMEAIARPKISPEGSWILYSQSKIDAAKDRFSDQNFCHLASISLGLYFIPLFYYFYF